MAYVKSYVAHLLSVKTLTLNLQGERNSKPDYGAVRQAISDLLDADDYDDGTPSLPPSSLLPFSSHLSMNHI